MKSDDDSDDNEIPLANLLNICSKLETRHHNIDNTVIATEKKSDDNISQELNKESDSDNCKIYVEPIKENTLTNMDYKFTSFRNGLSCIRMTR